MRPYAAYLLSILVVFTSQSVIAEEAIPNFKRGTPYVVVRSNLLKQGWRPAKGVERYCENGHPLCKYPEISACAPTGYGQCDAYWRKGEIMIEVGTMGDAPGVFESLRLHR